MLVFVDGIDGTGKTTLIENLTAHPALNERFSVFNVSKEAANNPRLLGSRFMSPASLKKFFTEAEKTPPAESIIPVAMLYLASCVSAAIRLYHDHFNPTDRQQEVLFLIDRSPLSTYAYQVYFSAVRLEPAIESLNRRAELTEVYRHSFKTLLAPVLASYEETQQLRKATYPSVPITLSATGSPVMALLLECPASVSVERTTKNRTLAIDDVWERGTEAELRQQREHLLDGYREARNRQIMPGTLIRGLDTYCPGLNAQASADRLAEVAAGQLLQDLNLQETLDSSP